MDNDKLTLLKARLYANIKCGHIVSVNGVTVGNYRTAIYDGRGNWAVIDKGDVKRHVWPQDAVASFLEVVGVDAAASALGVK